MAGSLLDQIGALQGQLRRLVEEVGDVKTMALPEPHRLRELSGLWRECGPLRPIEIDEVRFKSGSES